MVKFIHTADWQIGMKAAHVGAVGQRVRAERLEAARRVIEAATRHRADFIMVAGDTFRFWIPERLAYKGRRSRPQGMLVFDVQMLVVH